MPGKEIANPIMLNIIDERLFAHICCDAHLAGAFDLEGENSAKTSAFLLQYLKKCIEENDSSLALTKSQQLLNALSDLSHYASEINKTILDPQNWKQTSEKICTEILEKINQLKTDEFILLPGGWSTHAMVYELRKTNSGALLVNIYNSGAGISEHQSSAGRFDSVMTYEIPESELDTNNFNKEFPIIIKNILKSKNRAVAEKEGSQIVDSGEDLYRGVLSKLSYLGGAVQEKKVQDPSLQYKRYTRGQLSGTCAQNSLHEMLKSQFESIEDYQRYIYKFKAYALDEYIKLLKLQNAFQDPQKTELLIKGIKSNLRLLNRKASNGSYIFDEKFKKKEHERLSEYLRDLHNVKRKKQQATTSHNEVKKLPEMVHALGVLPTVTVDQERQRVDDKENQYKEKPILKVDRTDISTSTKDLIADLSTIVMSHSNLHISSRFN